MMRFFAEFILERSEGLRMTAAVSFEHLIFGSFDPFDKAQGRLCSGQVLILFPPQGVLRRISIFEFRVYGKMPKDLKIGMLLGLVLVTVVMVWLSTGTSLSPKAGGPDTHSNPPPQKDSATTNNFSTNGLTAQSADQSKPPDSTIYEQTEKIKTQKFHIIRQGETLSDISHKYYGSANKWRMILDANRDVIKDANKLRPGTKLIIPE